MTTKGGELSTDADGCFVKLLSDDEKTICIREKSSITTFDPKSKTDSLLMKGQGIFQNLQIREVDRARHFLDIKGKLQKDSSGDRISIILKGEVTGGIDDGFVFTGNFNSRIVPEF